MESAPHMVIAETYHGQPHFDKKYPEGHYFHLYPPTAKLVDKNWDFYTNPCNNSTVVGDRGCAVHCYRCEGHIVKFHGSKIEKKKKFPGYYFFIYPKEKELVDKTWDFHTSPCNHSQFIEERHGNVHMMECKGHEVTFHGKMIEYKKYGKHHFFHIHPKTDELQEKGRDFHENNCNHSELVEEEGQVKIYKCLGH